MQTTEIERFKNIRMHLNLTQSAMADKINVEQTTISAIETGRHGISEIVIHKLKTILKVNPKYITEGESPKFLESINSETSELLAIKESDSLEDIYKDAYNTMKKYNDVLAAALEDFKKGANEDAEIIRSIVKEGIKVGAIKFVQPNQK
jgi:transcriptional regulator with XRE-family HTH domain